MERTPPKELPEPLRAELPNPPLPEPNEPFCLVELEPDPNPPPIEPDELPNPPDVRLAPPKEPLDEPEDPKTLLFRPLPKLPLVLRELPYEPLLP